MRALFLLLATTLLLAWSGLIADAAEAPAKSVLIIVPTEALYPAADRRLASSLATELRPITRFRLMPLPAGGAGSTGTRGLDRARAIALEAGAETALVVGFLRNPEPRFVRLTDVTGRYQSTSEVEVALVDATPERTRLHRTLPFRGESPGSSESAFSTALDEVVRTIAGELKAAYRLRTRIVHRSGRALILAHGADLGIQPGMFFSGDRGLGRIRVSAVADQSAQAELLEGYYDLHEGDPIVEQSFVSFPATAGLVRTELLGPRRGDMTGLLLAYNRSGYGLGASMTLGQMNQDGVGGMGLVAQIEPQHEIIPERLWSFAALGVAGELLTQRIPGTGEHAGSQAIHGTLAAGLGGRWGSAEATLGVGYWTPFVADRWNQTTGVIDPIDASSRVIHPLLGGWLAQASLTWAF